MSIRPSDLRTVPLFRNITDEHLDQLTAAFERLELPEGELLFEAGTLPTHFLLLVRGEVTLAEHGAVRFRLHPIAPIGELGALTGLKRNTTAKVSSPSEIWRIAVPDLIAHFERHGDVAFPFYHNLLNIVADKIRRDEVRLGDVRANLIRTQKAMKRLRDLVLETEETALSTPLFDTLDELIEQNKRIHYLVEPPSSLEIAVRMDDGARVRVRSMSDGFLRLEPAAGEPPAKRSPWMAVLGLPSGEFPVSGRVERADAEGVLIELDPLIPEYAAPLEEFLTRMQMLDFIV